MTRGRGKSQQSIKLINTAIEILEEIQPATLRAVCYRLFIAGILTSMSKAETNKVSTQLTWARENEHLPWEWVVDETRAPERINAWENPEAFAETVKRAYRKDRWETQPYWVEVWSEKGTVRGTLAPILDKYGVTFRVMHGYGSATALYQAALESQQSKKRLNILYVGDWDCSGMHMSEVDLPERLTRYGARFRFDRVALIERDLDGLPSFPASDKRLDKRHSWYVQRYGGRCWELDALNPVTLRNRIEDSITHYIDFDAWERADVVERAEQESLVTILNAWKRIISGPATERLDGHA